MTTRPFILSFVAALALSTIGCGGHHDAACFSPENPLYTNCAPGAPNGCACMEGIDKRSCVPDKSRGLALVCTNGKWEAVSDLSCAGDAGTSDDMMSTP